MPFLSINETRVHIQTAGHGRDVVIALHGSGGDAGQWRRIASNVQRNYRIIAPDLIGHGNSDDWDGRQPVSLAQDVNIVARLAEKLKGHSIHLIGYGYGGAVALKCAAQMPVASLTLIEPSAFWMLGGNDPADRKQLHEVAWLSRQLDRAIFNGDYSVGMQTIVDYWTPGAWDELDSCRQKKFIALAPAVGFQMRSLLAEELDYPARRKIDVPTLLLHAERARPPAIRVIEKLFRELPAAKALVLDGASGNLPVTDANRIGCRLMEHIAEAGAKQPELALSA